MEYQDVSAEVEARLAAKEKKKQEKIEAKKRKRASTDSVGVTTQLHSDGHPIAERPKKRKKARIEENEQEHEQEHEQEPPSHGATTDMPSTDDAGTAAPVASPTTDPDIGSNTKLRTEMNGQDGEKVKGGQKRAKRPKSGPDKANKRRKVAHSER